MVGTARGRVTSAAGLHHRDGADSDHFGDILFGGKDIGEGVGHEALAAVGAVVGGDDQGVAVGAELVFPEDLIAIAEADDGDGTVAGLFVLAELGVDGGDAEPAADEDDGAAMFAYVAGKAEGADEVEDGVAFAEGHHLEGSLADGLNDDGDRARIVVEIGDGERDAFAAFVDAGHHEVAGTRGVRHVGREDVPKEGDRTELLPMLDEKHNTPYKALS